MSDFVINGLDPAPFLPLFALDDAALAARGVVRMTATDTPGFPCRITLEDAGIGETVLLLNFDHHAVATPYRQRHAIFVRQGATAAARYRGVVPRQLALRLISLRAYDADGMMRAADVAPGQDLAALIDRLFADPAVAYLHAHNAKPGCFAARIDRG